MLCRTGAARAGPALFVTIIPQISENTTENVICLYTYEGAAPIAVTFTLGEDNAVSATGTFVLYDGFTAVLQKRSSPYSVILWSMFPRSSLKNKRTES